MRSSSGPTVCLSFRLTVEPQNAPPTLKPVASHTLSEGDTLRFRLSASDLDGDKLTYFSPTLPAGAFLDPNTGEFEWTVGYTQAGTYDLTFSVTDGETSAETRATFTVLNANGAPVFDPFGSWDIVEGQPLLIQLFAFDPDNPEYIPQVRGTGGVLSPLEGTAPSLTYAVSGLPAGATFDPDTLMLEWQPGFNQAGSYNVSVTATDDGDGTGAPLSVTTAIPILVRNANRSPEVGTVANQFVDRGAVLEVPVATTDPDGNPLVLTASGLPRFGSFVDNGDGTGLFRFAPGAGDRGDYTVTLTATDNGDGEGARAVLSGSTSFVLTARSLSEAPVLDWIGDQVAVVGQTLRFAIQAHDLDQDPLTFSATGLPAGATLTPDPFYGRAILEWTPTAATLGAYPLTFTVADNGNNGQGPVGQASRSMSIIVRETNQAPALAPIGGKLLAEGAPFELALKAADLDGDMLSYRAENLPAGATFDAQTGIFRWTPHLFQAGDYAVTFSVTDGNLSASETVQLTVQNTNQAPRLAYLPTQSVREGVTLSFSLIGGDPDADPILYRTLSGLPAGAFFDDKSGSFEWTPTFDQAGEYPVTFGVTDASGATYTQVVLVRVSNVNRAPVLAVQKHAVLLGNELRFSMHASDPDQGTTLTYSAIGLPEGATLDSATGEIVWVPGPGQAGDILVRVSVSDGAASTMEPLLLRALTAPQSPSVTIETTPSFPALPGQDVVVHVLADSFSAIATRSLTVNGAAVTLDAEGRATVRATAPGKLTLVASATDIDGFTGSVTHTLKIRDPLDKSAPAVAFDAGTAFTLIGRATDLAGRVLDANLDAWVLEIAHQGTDRFVELARGAGPIEGALYRLNPAEWANGVYELRLTATDISGRMAEARTVVQIASSAKEASYLRTDLDATVMLGGHAFELARQYDSLGRSQDSGLGFGWRLPIRDFALESDLPITSQDVSLNLPYREGTRVYATLPDGQRVAFVFHPERKEIPGLIYYVPRWEAESAASSNTGWALESAFTHLQRAGDRYFDIVTGLPYNPQALQGGAPQFTLTAPDGTKYGVDFGTGTREVRFADGVKWTLSDSGIVSSNGEALRFLSNDQGRIERIVLPDGREFAYGYDASGNLESVRNLSAASSSRYGYAADDAHLLTLATGGIGEGGSAISYEGVPSAAALTADLGAALSYLSQSHSGTLGAGATDRYSFALRPSELASSPTGAVYVGVIVEAEAGSTVQPAIPALDGYAPVASSVQGSSAFALYRVDRAALQLLEIAGASGATSGAYRLSLFVAGDANRDGLVDGLDTQALTAAFGSVAGAANYNTGADFNRDGQVNATDRQLLAASFGYRANQAPTVQAQSAKTHLDLEADVPAGTFLSDLEGDKTYFRVTGATHGSARLSGDGQSVVFMPEAGYSGSATFSLVADDGYSQSPEATVIVNISDAKLLKIHLERIATLAKGSVQRLVLTGDFADERGVALPANYLEFLSSDAGVVEARANGTVRGLSEGTAILTAKSHGIQAFNALGVFQVAIPDPADQGAESSQEPIDPGVYPGTLTLTNNGGKRQLKITAVDGTDITTAAMGTLYFVGNPDVATITPDGLVMGLAEGVTTLSIINGAGQQNVELKVQAPSVGATLVNAQDGGAVQGADGSLVMVGPGALAGDAQVSIAKLNIADVGIPLPAPNVLNALGAFRLDLGPDSLNAPVQLALHVTAPIDPATGLPRTLPAGTEVFFLLKGTIADEFGVLHDTWWVIDNGHMDENGIARTASIPYPGILDGGTLLVVAANTLLDSLADAGLAAWDAVWASDAYLAMSGFVGSAVSSALDLFERAASSSLALLSYQLDGINRRNALVAPTGDGSFTIQVPQPPSQGPTVAPVIGAVGYNNATGELEIDGSFGGAQTPIGSTVWLRVWIEPKVEGVLTQASAAPDRGLIKKSQVVPYIVGSDEPVHIQVPATVALSQHTVRVERASLVVTGGTTAPDWTNAVSGPRVSLAQSQALSVVTNSANVYLYQENQGALALLKTLSADERGIGLQLNGFRSDPIAFADGGNLAFIAGRNGKVYMLDMTSLEVVHTIEIGSGGNISSLAVADGWLYVAEGARLGGGPGRLTRIDLHLEAGRFLTVQQLTGLPSAPAGYLDLAVSGNRYLAVTAPAQPPNFTAGNAAKG